MAEAYEGVHESQLTRMIQLQPRNALAVGEKRRLRQLPKLAAIDKSFQDVLLDVVVIVDNGGDPLPQLWQILDGFFSRRNR